MPTKIRHLPWLVCLVIMLAACSSGDNKSTTAGGPETSVSAGTQETDNGDGDSDQEEPGEDGDCEAAATEEEREECEQAGGDPDADLPGADRGPEFPEDPFIEQRLLSGAPTRTSFDAAAAQARLIRTATARQAPALAKAGWKFRGPRTVGGRVIDAAVDPLHRGGLYVATSTAGIWHSTDSGATFTSVWPAGVTHAMGAIAIASDGTLYVGTGETNPGGGSITYGGQGMYRSTDGGATWKHVGLASSGAIGRIVVDPLNPKRIWVAASGNLFVPGGQRGVYVSTNGGNSWKQALKPPNPTTGGVDITVDPKDSDHVVAAMWDHFRGPDERQYTGVGSGIWETHNGGTSWQRLGKAQGLPAPAEDVGRIGVSFAPSDGDQVYAIYANNEAGSFENFFRSKDNGASWSRAPGADDLGGSQSTYGWWFARIFVDPDNAKRMYVAGLSMYQSTDGADNFGTVGGGLHADQHIAVWDTHQGGDIYIGNDGGLYASSTDGASWTHSADEPWSQYVSLDVSEQDPTRFLGGLQDNGTRASWTSPPYQDIIGGDGQRSLISATDKDTYYGCYQYGNCTGFSGGSQFAMPIDSDRFPFFMPMEFQPGDPSVIYSGGNELNRSTDGGHTFTTLTGDLGHGGGGSSSYPYGTISALGISADPKIIWVGTDNGYLYRSTDKGANFTQLPPPVQPRLWITRILVDPADSKSVFISFSGYRSGDNSPYVLHTANSGKTWTDISANLPKAPVSKLLLIGRTLYAGTDVGIFSTAVANPSWRSVGHGLPQLIVTDLRYIKDSSTLYASTFGMGVWSVKL